MLEGFYTTAKGLEYFAKAAAGKRLIFTIGKFGSGVLDESVNPATVTEFVNALGTLPIIKKSTEANKVTVITSFSNRVGNAFLPEFHLTEVGLYGRIEMADGSVDPEGEEALLLYSYTAPSKSDFIPATLSEFTIAFPIIMSGSANVSVNIDDSLVYTPRKEFEEHVFFKTNSTGTGASIIVTNSGLSLFDGLSLTVKLNEDMVDNATLSFNGSEAYPIINMNGERMTAGAVAGAYINVVFSAEDECWYLIGGTGSGGGGSSTDLIVTEFVESIEGEEPEIDVAVQNAIIEAVNEASQNATDALDAHKEDQGNPHGVTAEQTGAAKSEEHCIKSYTSYTQLGLTIDDMASDDFNGNIAKIVEAMPNYTVLEMNAYDSKLANSVVNKINAELPAIGLSISNDFVLRIEKTTKAFPAKVDAIIDSSTYSRIFTCIVHYVDSSSAYVVTNFVITYSPADAGYHSDATSGRTTTIFAGTDGRAYIRNVKDSNNRSALYLNPETLTDAEMQGFLRLQKMVAGTATYYDVYGTHNIKKGTTDIGAGSALATGTIHLVYEP